jgi:hypothetical protein
LRVIACNLYTFLVIGSRVVLLLISILAYAKVLAELVSAILCYLDRNTAEHTMSSLRNRRGWRNNSASDSGSEGWELESFCPHLQSHLSCFMKCRVPAQEMGNIDKQVVD